MNTQQLKELRNALSCWQGDYDRDDDKEQYDMFGAAIDAVSRLEKAERERDELRSSQEHEGDCMIDALASRDEWRLRAVTAEAEIARRDASAGEPVGYLFTSSEGQVVFSPCPWAVEGLTLQGPVYTAAPPAVRGNEHE